MGPPSRTNVASREKLAEIGGIGIEGVAGSSGHSFTALHGYEVQSFEY